MTRRHFLYREKLLTMKCTACSVKGAVYKHTFQRNGIQAYLHNIIKIIILCSRWLKINYIRSKLKIHLPCYRFSLNPHIFSIRRQLKRYLFRLAYPSMLSSLPGGRLLPYNLCLVLNCPLPLFRIVRDDLPVQAKNPL